MRVLFRADASFGIGTGHVMRCLTLAEALREHEAECRFICREYEGHLLEQISSRGFDVIRLPFYTDFIEPINFEYKKNIMQSSYVHLDWEVDALQTKACIDNGITIDWLIVDNYALDIRWERAVLPICKRLMVIDDLANRPHDCHLLLDQNFYQDQDRRYHGLVPKYCKTLLGPSYALLRPEFEKARKELRSRNGVVKRILIFFGGSDLKNQTQLVLTALKIMNIQDISVDVVVGCANPNHLSIQKFCNQLPWATFHYNISNMAELIASADLGIGAGGTAMWERSYLGLPTITTVTAENQKYTTEDFSKLNAIEYLGSADLLGENDYRSSISNLISNSERLQQMSYAGLDLMQTKKMSSIINELTGTN